jgi:hypothetical protein
MEFYLNLIISYFSYTQLFIICLIIMIYITIHLYLMVSYNKNCLVFSLILLFFYFNTINNTNIFYFYHYFVECLQNFVLFDCLLAFLSLDNLVISIFIYFIL